MSRVFEYLIDEKIAPAAAVPAFRRYLTDPGFRHAIESRMLVHHRVSLATLAGSLPSGMGALTLRQVLYDMRHRFRSALELLRELDLKITTGREIL